MKTFDFNHKDFKKHSPEMQIFLRKVYKSGISENDFVKTYVKIPRQKGKSKRGHRSPSYGRIKYKYLKKDWNFF